jgi:hypothetical protein
MSSAHGAVHAAPCWHELRIPLVERSKLEDEQDVRLNPELQTADGEQDVLRLLPSGTPILFEAGGKCLFLLIGLQFRQQERIADADFLAIEIDHDRRKFSQLQTSRDVGRILAGTCRNLFAMFYGTPGLVVDLVTGAVRC